MTHNDVLIPALILLSLPLATCEVCKDPGLSALPPEGAWTLMNVDEMPVDVESVVVDGDLLTVSWRDEDGVVSQVRYRIEPIE